VSVEKPVTGPSTDEPHQGDDQRSCGCRSGGRWRRPCALVGGAALVAWAAVRVTAVHVERRERRPENVLNRAIEMLEGGSIESRAVHRLHRRSWRDFIDTDSANLEVRGFAYRLPPRVWKRLTVDGVPPKPLPEHRRVRAPIPAAAQEAVLAAAGFKCSNCPASSNLEIDHLIPWSWGGTNHLFNLQVLCRACNRRKGARLRPDDLIVAVARAA
jgi:hypothetical protein